MPPSEVRAALILATNEYHDEDLSELRAPAHDAEALARVLADPKIGNFEVSTVINQPSYVVMEEIETFFSNRHRNDLLTLYFSCHGLKDDNGRLYFAATNTRRHLLAATAIAASWVNERLDSTRSNRVVLVLDCCYSGAFARAIKGDDLAVGVKERFDGRGRVILTASNTLEYSFEGDEVSGSGQTSLFTDALVQGLETGEADRGGDGLIDVDELYDYVYERVRGRQTPQKWALAVEGDLYLARSRRGPVPAALPPELLQAIASPLAFVREGAVKTLSLMLKDSKGLALLARQTLRRIADEDDSLLVRRNAAAALIVEQEPHLVEPATREKSHSTEEINPVLTVGPPGSADVRPTVEQHPLSGEASETKQMPPSETASQKSRPPSTSGTLEPGSNLLIEYLQRHGRKRLVAWGGGVTILCGLAAYIIGERSRLGAQRYIADVSMVLAAGLFLFALALYSRRLGRIAQLGDSGPPAQADPAEWTLHRLTVISPMSSEQRAWCLGKAWWLLPLALSPCAPFVFFGLSATTRRRSLFLLSVGYAAMLTAVWVGWPLHNHVGAPHVLAVGTSVCTLLALWFGGLGQGLILLPWFLTQRASQNPLVPERYQLKSWLDHWLAWHLDSRGGAPPLNGLSPK
jgi:hypothetical protein